MVKIGFVEFSSSLRALSFTMTPPGTSPSTCVGTSTLAKVGSVATLHVVGHVGTVPILPRLPTGSTGRHSAPWSSQKKGDAVSWRHCPPCQSWRQSPPRTGTPLRGMPGMPSDYSGTSPTARKISGLSNHPHLSVELPSSFKLRLVKKLIMILLVAYQS